MRDAGCGMRDAENNVSGWLFLVLPFAFCLLPSLKFREFRLEIRELRAGAREHLALHVEFLARHQIEAAESGLHQDAKILLDIRCRAAGEDLFHLPVHLFEKSGIGHIQ